MVTMQRHVSQVLASHDLPRSQYTTTPDGHPRWTYGYGLSVVRGQVTVWCNPGGFTPDSWHQSVRLAQRITQILEFAGFRVHTAEGDPQQVVVLSHHEPRLARASKFVSLAAIFAALASVLAHAPGLLMLSVTCFIGALALGLTSDRRVRVITPTQKGTTP